jgi:hypothetical protein
MEIAILGQEGSSSHHYSLAEKFVNEGRIIGVAETNTELVEVMDTKCNLKSDHVLHDNQGPTFEISIVALI